MWRNVFILAYTLFCLTLCEGRSARSNCRGVECEPAKCVDARFDENDEDQCCLICPQGRCYYFFSVNKILMFGGAFNTTKI